MLSLPRTKYVTVDKFPSAPSFTSTIKQHYKNTTLIGLFQGLNEVTHVKNLQFYLANSKYSIHVNYYYFPPNTRLSPMVLQKGARYIGNTDSFIGGNMVLLFVSPFLCLWLLLLISMKVCTVPDRINDFPRDP